ncbi:MAG: efflux RND transporter permease subunit [Polyangiaceae bacterium]
MSALSIGKFALRHARAILFIVFAMCVAGVYSAFTMPSSVFPQTNFPRVVILVDNGVMPADEMMATVTRPIEEAMKDIPGATTVRSATGRGSADVNVFFTWDVDMVQSELFVLSRLSQIRSTLPATAETNVFRLTFSAFPIVGISLTSRTRDIASLWETARYDIKPRFLRVPGVARVDLVGGREPEIQVVVDPTRLSGLGLGLSDISDELARTNLVAPAGLHEEDNLLYLAVVDGRAHTIDEVADLTIAAPDGHPVRLRDVADVRRGEAPAFNVVTADGVNAVLLNVRSQPDGSTLAIADRLKEELSALRHDLPPDMKLQFFYDQSLLVRSSVLRVWEAVVFGLLLSVVILYLFLRNWGTTLVATLVIPITVLFTLVAMKAFGMSFNLMTLGGIAAAIGLVVDDAIVVVEAIYTKQAAGLARDRAVEEATREIFLPLVGSTLTPVVVFVPLAFLDGVPGVFFRALALTMVVSLLTSLLLAVTLTPSLAARLMRAAPKAAAEEGAAIAPKATAEEGAAIADDANAHDGEGADRGLHVRIYERALRLALGRPWVTAGLSALLVIAGAGLYLKLDSDFLPPMDEGGFVIDYIAPPGTSLSETNRALLHVEEILRSTKEVESYSRRTGAALGYHLVEPNTGDFLVKLRPDRDRSTDEVVSELRRELRASAPHIDWEFPGILSDLIGDLTWSPEPIEIKLFSPDVRFLEEVAPTIEDAIAKVDGVVDTKDGLVYTGPTISLRLRSADAQRFGLDASEVGRAVNIALLGERASTVLQGDRVVGVRVKIDPTRVQEIETIKHLLLRAPNGTTVRLSQVADVVLEPGQLELHREDLRQNVAVTARLEGRDLGSAIGAIQEALAEKTLPPGTIEIGGLYEQQVRSFRNLLVVLGMAVFLVFTVLVLEFGSFVEPIAIVLGAVLALFGSVLALLVTGASLNVISFLGAIIGVGIVAKNGILMLDRVEHLRAEGLDLVEAVVRSGRRRLRPVLMTSLAAIFGMLPLAAGIGSGADMLKPLAIAVIGALVFSSLLSLIATPTAYLLMKRERT